jgi:CRP-like cAMP-binding protein
MAHIDVVESPSHAVRLHDADPEFARAVPAEDRELADRALAVRVRAFAPGDTIACNPEEAVGLLILTGAAWREVVVGAAAAPQLLGPGGVVLCEPARPDLLAVVSALSAVLPTEAALLDRRYLMAASHWPRLASILHARLSQQERDLHTMSAIGQLPRVDERLHMLLWHLAERWGRVATDGVHLPLRLTHATLGRFVGARRPTVSLALGQLREQGKAVRRTDGTWMLHGDPRASARPAPPAPPPLDLFV